MGKCPVPIVGGSLLLIPLCSLWILQGIFQLHIVLVTLTTHYTAISNIAVDDCGEQNPVGALVLSLQAVCSVFYCYSALIVHQVK
jgi:hypothetical protein